jgi:Fur family zinc uptake transcriptional regulator
MARQQQGDALTDRASRLCRQRGVRFTPQRRRVLGIIAGAGQPLGAYEILAALRQRWPKTAPPTVYRALDFLQQQGFVHRLATLQAYVTCEHPGDPHAGQFLICSRCGRVEELVDAAVVSCLDRAASAAGFRPIGEVVEVTGRCCRCERDAGP